MYKFESLQFDPFDFGSMPRLIVRDVGGSKIAAIAIREDEYEFLSKWETSPTMLCDIIILRNPALSVLTLPFFQDGQFIGSLRALAITKTWYPVAELELLSKQEKVEVILFDTAGRSQHKYLFPNPYSVQVHTKMTQYLPPDINQDAIDSILAMHSMAIQEKDALERALLYAAKNKN